MRTSTGASRTTGATRKQVTNRCKDLHLSISAQNFTLLDTYSADEIFLTGTFGGLTRVESLDGHKILYKSKDSILKLLRDSYEDLIEKY